MHFMMAAMALLCDRRVVAAAVILCCILFGALNLTLGTDRAHAQTADDAPLAIWIDEDKSGRQSDRRVGSVVWSTVVFSGTSDQSMPVVTGTDPKDVVALAKIEIPDGGVSATWLLRCITDPNFPVPATHLVEIKFKLPKDLADIGIQMIRGVGAKQSEQSPASVLSGLALSAQDTWTFALRARDTDLVRNVRLLKEAKWFEVPLYYNHDRGGGAALLIEKGHSGDRAFAEVFKIWGNRACTTVSGLGAHRR
jgi:hypothetical protein